MSKDAKQCPHCARWCLKDDACNYIFACGLQADNKGFVIGSGCGKPWCYECGKKFCGTYIDPVTGQRIGGAREHHDASCCSLEQGYKKEDYCPGGHNSHCGPR